MKSIGILLVVIGVIGVCTTGFRGLVALKAEGNGSTDLYSYAEQSYPPELDALISQAGDKANALSASAATYGKFALLAGLMVLLATSLATIVGGLFTTIWGRKGIIGTTLGRICLTNTKRHVHGCAPTHVTDVASRSLSCFDVATHRMFFVV